MRRPPPRSTLFPYTTLFRSRAFRASSSLCDQSENRKLPAARYTRDPRLSMSGQRSEEHTSELQSQSNLVCRLLLEKKKKEKHQNINITQVNNIAQKVTRLHL